jgi:hypothetical protein
MKVNLVLCVFVLGCFVEMFNCQCPHMHKLQQQALNDVTKKKEPEPEKTRAGVLLAIEVNNNEYSMNQFLKSLEMMTCGEMARCNLWFYFNNCTDNSVFLFKYWMDRMERRGVFNSIQYLDSHLDDIMKKNVNFPFL